MGSSDQAGNEIDEFVTETLRNNLLGLPLDLPTINMTRAREAGIPPLNDVRRQIFAQTNDGQLAPYTTGRDFGQHLKHPESLINFVAAYGTHPSITSATTLADKRNGRASDRQPVGDRCPPADAADFMFSTGAWSSNANGVTTTGLDDVDLWVGGLAEITNLFGGLLGSTFNYVFQTQLEKLQDGDRLYYLARTPGMNLRTQLEGNSFSEMIQRNTDGTNTLKADAFATADCKFQIANLESRDARPAVRPQSGAGRSTTTRARPTATRTSCCCTSPTAPRSTGSSTTSTRPASTASRSTTAPPTRTGSSAATTTTPSGVATVNDVIEGNGGDDVALGGEGNDIITDLAGADVPKGGPGNDAIDAGIGDDIPMGNAGSGLHQRRRQRQRVVRRSRQRLRHRRSGCRRGLR